MTSVRSVLFVCSGNTCRSPMAEGIFRAEAAKRGLDIQVASAGTNAEAVVAPNAVAAAAAHGGDISKHKPQQLTATLAANVDLILTMTQTHLSKIPENVKGRAARLHDYAQDGKGDVSDPVGQNLPVYKGTADELQRAIVKVLDRIQREAQP